MSEPRSKYVEKDMYHERMITSLKIIPTKKDLKCELGMVKSAIKLQSQLMEPDNQLKDIHADTAYILRSQ